MLYLDLALRGGAITLLLLLAFMLWHAPVGREGRLSVAAVALTESAFLVTSSALPLTLPPVILSVLLVLAALSAVSITWLIVTIFLDAPGRRWPWIAAGFVASGSFYLTLVDATRALYCLPIAVTLYGALFALSLWSTKDDLVECRCRARPGFAAAIAGLALVLTLGQATGLLQAGSLQLALVHSAGTFVVALAFAIWLLRPAVDRWPGVTDATGAPRVAGQDMVDPALILRIRSAMAAEIWREEGLTIGTLAGRLGVPEHRLRRAINQGLGHRNFSSFINQARVSAARNMLIDPTRMSTTVLEIAFDVGFSSIGPFNRAFRAEFGQSPTEYRHMFQAGGFAESENLSPIPGNLH